MQINFVALFIAAIVTLVTGFIWYSPKVFGTIWMKENNFTQEELRKGNMLKIFGLTYIFSLMITMTLMSLTIHQSGAVGMVGGPPLIDSAKPSFAAFMADYGMAYRTFKHGALHGFMSGLFFAFPLIGINGLFERKSWKYIFIHSGYWILTLTLMGGIICGFA
ncbi:MULTISPECIES: DUF1761 domain-containing protein [Flavobacterium]|uniref:DUF1761 domain containing protein n=1 Tax=Flavobacterium anhuiense TaxID=459526 RepID=A0ABY0M403_9FLAO|nr:MULTISPECIES: DUF1761 domain-containing protein [Flavobacterium]EJG00344.1 hypothetical protein FF52_15787 [Flavobacterium sp. F52]MXO03992.1 DUF1761 family protein [Flavobacterium sp. HBTb2-11-1]URM38616.1 DUF1761 domain-containing protein [Flavobacterium anhuiense]SCY98666.1 Protein of unknown function [Flavobacterium anhuiense]